jgi:hypothetical protein
MTTDTDAGRDLTRAEFERACSLLPPDFAWGLPVTPRLVLEVANALASTPSAQEEAVRVNEWQPIETAPKTGRTLLLGYPNVLGKWRTTRGQWMSETYIAEYWEEPDDVEPGWFETSVEADDIPNCWRIEPTHWMPLPAAPAASAGDQEVGA